MTIQDNEYQDSQRSTKNKSSEMSPTCSLPIELILEILLWLPVFSLLKCRSVCKLWLSLISSPHFVKTHLLKSSESSQFDARRLISAAPSPPYNKTRNCSVYSLLNEPFCMAVEVDCPIKDPSYPVYFVGSCNGLLCLAATNKPVLLWNPATRKSKRLQISEKIVNYKCYNRIKEWELYGFGYDECNDDYKVVGIYCFFVRDNNNYNLKVEIYSSRLDRWRSIEDFPFRILRIMSLGGSSNDSGNFANGALHWAASRDMNFESWDYFESWDSWVIVSLDLKTEKYGEVVQPNYGEGAYNLSLGVLERSLCVLCNYENIRADVWLMKEYGVKESWTKLVSIPYIEDEPTPFGYSVPLCIFANGDIVLVYKYGIVVYNSKYYRFKDTVNTKFNNCLTPYIYIESLVSPNV